MLRSFVRSARAFPGSASARISPLAANSTFQAGEGDRGDLPPSRQFPSRPRPGLRDFSQHRLAGNTFDDVTKLILEQVPFKDPVGFRGAVEADRIFERN